MRASHPIPENGSIKVVLPEQLLIEDKDVSMPSCAPIIGFGPDLTCECLDPCEGETREIVLSDLGFTDDWPATELLEFTIDAIRNPVSL